MKYNTAGLAEKVAAITYFHELVNKNAIIEVKKISPKRSINQNSYLHLIISAFGNHFGYTLEEAKQVYKNLNANIYFYEKNGIRFCRSSADLSVDEMTASIEKFREESAGAGCPLPTAVDQGWLRSIENDIEHTKYNLRG
jgi:hypothetical protein